jgi:drug/metabolite transporter (DMT)-like permease
MNARHRWLTFGALVIVNLLWAGQYPAYKVAVRTMSVASVNFWTLAIALAFLLPFFRIFTAPSTVPNTRRSAKTIWEFAVLGTLGIIPPSVMLAWGIDKSSASNASILSLTIPVVMVVLGVIMLGERLTTKRTICLIAGLSGTLLVSSDDLVHASFSRGLLTGNLIILVAGFGSAFYNTYSKRLLERFSEIEVLVYSYVVAVVLCALLSQFFDHKPFYVLTGYGTATWIAIFVLAGLSWGIAMVIWMWALRRLDIGQISVSVYLLPFFGLLLSMVTLHERLSAAQIIGGAVTLAGTAALTAADRGSESNPVVPQGEANQ